MRKDIIVNKRIVFTIFIILFLFILSLIFLKHFSPYERVKKVIDSLDNVAIMEVNKLSSKGDFKYETVKIIDDKNIIEEIKNIILNAELIESDAITTQASDYKLVFLDDKNNILLEIGFPGIVINNIIVKITEEDTQKIYQYIE